MSPTTHTDIAPHTDLVRAASLSGIDKEEVYLTEDVKDVHQHERNSPEEILSRYPLLRDKSEQELKQLNNRIKKLM
jgi:hypothetical protein